MEGAKKVTYFAYSHMIPSVGRCFTCFRLERKDGFVRFAAVVTTYVLEVKKLLGHFYKVTTEDCVYYVQYIPELSTAPELVYQ